MQDFESKRIKNEAVLLFWHITLLCVLSDLCGRKFNHRDHREHREVY